MYEPLADGMEFRLHSVVSLNQWTSGLLIANVARNAHRRQRQFVFENVSLFAT